MKVIDLELDLPPNAEQLITRLKDYLFHSAEKGMANYGNVFGVQRARALDFTPEEIQRMKKEMSTVEIDRVLMKRAKKAVMTLPRFVQQMDEAGIEWGAVFAGDSDQTAAVVAQFPDRFIGTVNINPHLTLGFNSGSQGTYNLSAGSLSADGVGIGGSGTGFSTRPAGQTQSHNI